MKCPIYSSSDIAQIHSVIAGLRSLDDGAVEEAVGAISDGNCPEHLAPFWPIFAQDSGLFERLVKDPLVERYSIYGFSPAPMTWSTVRIRQRPSPSMAVAEAALQYCTAKREAW